MTNGIPVLMYHGITNTMAPYERDFTTPPAQFDAQMRQLVRGGYRALSMREAQALLQSGEPLDERMVAITFDDAFDCFLGTAVPILMAHGLVATVYAIPAYLGRRNDYAMPFGATPRMLASAADLREIQQLGFEVGSHTMTHQPLSKIGPDAVRREIFDAKAKLEDLLGTDVPSFAYPFGRFSRVARDLVEQAGHLSAVSTLEGMNRRDTDPLILRRATIGAGFDEARFETAMKYGGQPVEIAKIAVKSMLKQQIGRLKGVDPIDCILSELDSA